MSRKSNEWMEHNRIAEEVSTLKSEIEEDEAKVKDIEDANKGDQAEVQELQEELKNIQEMRELALRLKDSFGKCKTLPFLIFHGIDLCPHNPLFRKICKKRYEDP